MNDKQRQNVGLAKQWYQFVSEHDITADLSTYANQMRALILSKARNSLARNQEYGRVDRGRLANLIAGDTRVFNRKRQQSVGTTHMTVLVDASGSMDERGTLAALIMLDKIMAGTGIKYNVLAYGGGRDWNVVEIRGVDDTKADDWKIGSYAIVHGGGTPTVAGVYTAGQHLIKDVVADRKIMLVISDGEPNMHEEKDEVKRMATQMLPSMGVEVYGLSIGVDYLGESIPNSITVDSFRDFPKKLVELARKVIV